MGRRGLAIAVTWVVAACAERASPRDAGPPRTTSPVAKTPDAAPRDAAPAPDLWAVADFFMANVYEVPDFEGRRVGWIRVGSKVRLGEKVEGGRYCRDGGWHSLKDAPGFVCAGKGVVVGRVPRSVRLGSAPAALDQLNPYQYGFITRDGTPLYRRRPTRDEVREIEANWAARLAQEAAADAGAIVDAGPEPMAEPEPEPEIGEAPEAEEEEDEEEEDETEGGILVRRMNKGNYVAVDRRVGQGGFLFYRTIRGNFVQANRLFPVGPTTYQGIELAPGASPVPPLVATRPLAGTVDAGPADATPAATSGPPDAGPAIDAGPAPGPSTLPVGVVFYWHARKFHRSADGRRVSPRERLDRLTRFGIVAEVTVDDVLYYDTGLGWLVRADQARRMAPRSPPPSWIVPGEKWIDVDVSDQTLVAYEGERPVYATVVSTGLEDEEHRTPRGRFRIQSKHYTFTMADDRASDGPYSIEDVPYVMYFQLSYAIHSAFWHGWYGRNRSHGCVNVSPADARWLFHWVTPALPPGWYGVWARTEAEGTALSIHD